MFAIDLAKTADSDAMRLQMVKTADAELTRVAAVSAEILRKIPVA